MCGIVGYFKSRTEEFGRDLTEAGASIRHRGPDMTRIHSTPLGRVLFDRLAINDLSDLGMQPFSSGKVDAFINGEIYNHKELKHEFRREFAPISRSDAEILPFLYGKFGLSGLNRINGPFAAVIIDHWRGECSLASDRFGVKPLYYTHRGQNLFFASELKALDALITLDVDPLSVSIGASCYGFAYPLTPFKNVYRLEPGTALKYRDGQIEVVRWYQPKIEVCHQPTTETRDQFMQLFDSAVGMRLDCDVPVGGFISGGLDSTSILTVAKRRQGRSMHVFNAYIEDKESLAKNLTDNVNAARLASDLGLEYHPVRVNWDVYDRNIVKVASFHDEIMFDNGTFIFYLISKEAKKYVTVMIDGVGGDELFGGYAFQDIARKLGSGALNTQRRFPGLFSPSVLSLLSRLPRGHVRACRLYEALTNLPLWQFHALGILPVRLFGDRLGHICKRLEAIGKSRLNLMLEANPSDYGNALIGTNIFSIIAFQNTEAERGTMAYSIENRSPFLDYRLIELMMTVDSRSKVKEGQKALMRKWFHGTLPSYILEAKKSGPALALTRWIVGDEKRFATVSRFLEKNGEIIGTLLGGGFREAIVRRERALFQNGVFLHSLIATAIWGRKYLVRERLDENLRLSEIVS